MTLFPSPIPALIRSGGYDADGIWQVGVETPLTISGSVQVLSEKELESLEEASRSKGNVWVFTDAELTVASVGSATDGDMILWRGTRYLVVDKAPFQNSIIPHIRYRAESRGAA